LIYLLSAAIISRKKLKISSGKNGKGPIFNITIWAALKHLKKYMFQFKFAGNTYELWNCEGVNICRARKKIDSRPAIQQPK
jgi:hypothetical protein